MKFDQSDDFKLIRKQLFCVTPCSSIKFEVSKEQQSNCSYQSLILSFLQNVLESLSWEDQEIFMNLTFLDPLILKNPIKYEYQTTCLKTIIKLLEVQKDLEVNDVIYETYCRLSASSLSQEDFCYKHYILNDTVITLKESASFISNGTTGLCSWQAAKALAEWIIMNKDIFKEKTVLELGSGTGLLGIVTAKVCPVKRINLSDCHPVVLRVLEDNVKINHPEFSELEAVDLRLQSILQDSSTGKTISVMNLPWEEVDEIVSKEIIETDLIIASDIVYDNTLFDDLLFTVNKIFQLNSNKCKLIISCTERNPSTLEKFLNLLGNIRINI